MTSTKYFLPLAFILALFVSIQAQAQIGIGFRGGVLTSNQTVKDISNGQEEEFDSDNITGYMVGIPIEFGVSNIFAFQTEINYLKQGYRTSDDLVGAPQAKFTYDVLEIPILAKIGWTSEKISFAAVIGPSFQYIASGRAEVEAFDGGFFTIEASDEKIDFSQSLYEDITRTNIYGHAGIQLGAPVAGGKFVFDARYRFAVSDQSSSDDVEIKGRGASATLGYIMTFGNY